MSDTVRSGPEGTMPSHQICSHWPASLFLIKKLASHDPRMSPSGLLCGLLSPPSHRAGHVEVISAASCKGLTGR